MGKGVLDLDKKTSQIIAKNTYFSGVFFLGSPSAKQQNDLSPSKDQLLERGDILWMVGGFQLSREVPSGKLT